MSQWTQIHATIHVDFGNQTRYWISEFFEKMKDENYSYAYDPKKKGNGCEITGSEMNAVVTCVPLYEFDPEPRNRYSRGNQWIVTVSGNLRDRTFEETLAEWQRFAWRFGMFVKKSQKLDGFTIDEDSVRTAELLFWTVDICGYSNRRKESVHYHRSSIKEKYHA